MPQYNYQAVSRSGEKTKGVITAKDEGEVRILLRAQQLRPLAISPVSALETDLGQLFGGGVSAKDLLIFTRQLSVLIASGVPLIQGLDIISEQMGNSPMKKVILTIREKITGGGYLWQSLADHKKVFSDIYVNLVKAGEASGSIDVILQRLARYLDDAEKLKALVKSAMVYPIMVTIIALLVMTVMLVFVIPKFEDLLKSANQELPGPTQLVINASHFLKHNYPIVIGVAAVAVFLIRAYVKTQEGRRFVDYQSLKVPLFGPLFNKIAVARFARTMQTLLTSGVNLLDALEICKKSVGNLAIEESINRIKGEIEQGNRLSSIMAKIPYFPPMATQMVAVGENTGNIDKMLERVAEWYEEEARNLINNLTKMIEPLVLLVLGGMVGGMLIAMYLPVFKMAGAGGGG